MRKKATKNVYSKNEKGVRKGGTDLKKRTKTDFEKKRHRG